MPRVNCKFTKSHINEAMGLARRWDCVCVCYWDDDRDRVCFAPLITYENTDLIEESDVIAFYDTDGHYVI